jgi:hemoglobin
MRDVRDHVTEASIREMVERFYGDVRDDDLLGPMFARHMSADWPEHLDRMVDFWSSVLLASGRFRGNPRARHHAIPGLRPDHFDRWLELFEDVVMRIFPEHVGRDILGRAGRMRAVLEPTSLSDDTHDPTVISTNRTTR